MVRKPSLSLCIVAFNEEQLIRTCLESVSGLADDICLGLDTRTNDDTRHIAESFGARVIDVDWRDDFSYARNLTIDMATSDWILVIDADEVLTAVGDRMVRSVLQHATARPADDAVTGLGFLIGQTTVDGRVTSIAPSSIRLFRRRPEIRYAGRVHEEPVWLPDPSRTSKGLITGAIGILHCGYDAPRWGSRGKHERNRRLLEMRLAENPKDDYARDKLAKLERAG